jgi:hypothetical protein
MGQLGQMGGQMGQMGQFMAMQQAFRNPHAMAAMQVLKPF